MNNNQDLKDPRNDVSGIFTDNPSTNAVETLPPRKRLAFMPEDLERTVTQPCGRCGVPCQQNAAGLLQIGSCVCPKCAMAYYCFELAREGLRLAYRERVSDNAKRREMTAQRQKAQEALDYVAAGFKKSYGVDWKEYLKNIFSEYKRRLMIDLGNSPALEQTLLYGKDKGWLPATA